MKFCPKCKKEKGLFEFGKCSRNQDGKQLYCKECQREIYHEWFIKNKARLLKYQREWRAKNIVKYRKTMRDWRVAHPEKCREWLNLWRKNNPEKAKMNYCTAAAKRRQVPKYRISNSISSGILMSIQSGNKSNRHWEDLVGFTGKQLMDRLEKLFKRDMTWENYGKYWEIDHVIPISAFKFSTPEDIDFKICWALNNLQPLEIKKNRIKAGKIDYSFKPASSLGTTSGV